MLFLLSIVCLVFTFSRSGILVFTIIYFVEFLKWASYKNKIKSTITTLLVSIFILISIPSENEYLKAFNFSRINPFSQNEFIKEDTSRLDIISVYLNGINERPIFGHGPTQGAKQEVRAHNTTLNIWYEVGIMPTLTFLLFLFFLFFKSYKHLWLMNTFLIYLGFSFFINNLLFHPSFWMLLSCFYIAKDKIDIGPQHTWK
jgi:O-antigen ligase